MLRFFSNIYNITNPLPLDTVSVIKNNISCNGGNNGSIITDVIGGTPLYNYSWSNGDTSHQILDIAAGTYNVSITDLNGCSLPVLFFTLSEPLPSNMTNIISDVDCFGNSNGSIDITYITNSSNITTMFGWQSSNGFLSSQEDIYNLDPWVGTEIAFDLCGSMFKDEKWSNLECNLAGKTILVMSTGNAWNFLLNNGQNLRRTHEKKESVF